MEFVRENSVVIDVIATDPYTLVRVQCVIGGQGHDSVGFSKCNKNGDVYNKERGVSIAMGRAIANIARKLYQSRRRARVTTASFSGEEQVGDNS